MHHDRPVEVGRLAQLVGQPNDRAAALLAIAQRKKGGGRAGRMPMADFGMGGRGGEVRLICAAFLLCLHHSYQEIMVAAAGAGGPGYSGNADYSKLDPPGPTWMKSQVGPIPGDVPTA